MSGSVPCRTCGQPVPPGRLACPACGTLVAALSNATAGPVDRAPEPEPEPERLPDAWLASTGARAPEPESDVQVEPAEPEPEAEPEPAAQAEPEPGRQAEPEPEAKAAPEPEPPLLAAEATLPQADTPPAAESQADVASAPPAPPASGASEPDPAPTDVLPAAAPLEAWAPRTAPPPLSQPEPEPESVNAAAASAAVATGGIVPGAYLPPSTVHRPEAPSDAADPSSSGGWPEPAAPTRPWAPPSQGQWVPPTPANVAGAGNPAPATPPVKPLVPGRTSILSDLPFDAPDELEGWLVALGGLTAILGFFLPWTASLGTGFDGYFGSWGLGIVSHLPVFLFLIIVTALAILPNRVATWLRTGVCGTVGGGILFGIVWLYLGSDASQLGALLAAVGAVLLIVGGIIAVAPGRGARSREGA